MTGLRIRNTAGTVTFDAAQGHTIGKVLGRVTASAAAGSITDSRFAIGAPFAFTYSTGSSGDQKQVTFSGTTMSWTATPDAQEIFYGVGKGSNSYNPTKTAGAPYFIARNPDGSFIIDETFFALQLTGVFTFTSVAAGISIYDCAYSDDDGGDRPIVAIRAYANSAVTLLKVERLNSSTVRLTAFAQGAFKAYFFNKVRSASAGPVGLRLKNSSGTVLLDLSIPVFNPIKVQQEFTYTSPSIAVTGMVAGRQYAILANSLGGRVFLYGGTISNFRFGSRIITGTTETIYVEEVQISSNPAGPGSSNDYTSGYYSLIDVTGFD